MPHTCLACGLMFVDSGAQKSHFQTDWHRYNLKRKVAELPPLTQAEFEVRRQTVLQATGAAPAAPVAHKCDVCRKSFGTAAQLAQHFLTKKHLDVVKKAAAKEAVDGTPEGKDITEDEDRDEKVDEDATGEATDGPAASGAVDVPMSAGTAAGGDAADGVDGDEEPPEDVDLNRCFFCTTMLANVEENLAHMKDVHSFFIPYREFVVDEKQLLTYLAEKIYVGNCCMQCHRPFNSRKACQDHMRSTAHCHMSVGDDTDEFDDAYDFSSSYPEHLQGKPDEELEPMALAGAFVLPSGELRLPDGRIVGHRVFRQYYRQRFRQAETAAAKAGRLAIQDRHAAHGGSTALVVSDQGGVQSQPFRLARAQQFKRQMQLSINANKLQTFFRRQVDC